MPPKLPLKFSATVTYDVRSDGSATVTNRYDVENPNKEALKIDRYHELLPRTVDPRSVACMLSSMSGAEPIHFEAVDIPSYAARFHDPTNLRAATKGREFSSFLKDAPGRVLDHKVFVVNGKDDTPLQLTSGKSTLEIRYTYSQFYHIFNDNGCYMFAIHRSLPDLLGDVIVNMTLRVNIEKPSRWSRWSVLCCQPPQPGFRKYLNSFSTTMPLEFVSQLTPSQGYHNVVVLVRKRMLVPIWPTFNWIFNQVREKLNPTP